MDWDNIAFNTCALIGGLFVLQVGADLFTRYTAIIARRVGISETFVALLTVGTEWEELAIAVASILQHRSSIGLGNVIGSAISNILGVFALGLLVYPHNVRTFDLTAKIHAGALLVITSMFTLLALTGRLDITGGIFLLVTFAVYFFAVGSAIYEGILDDPMEEGSEHREDGSRPGTVENRPELRISIFPSTVQAHPSGVTPLAPNGIDTANESPPCAELLGVPYNLLMLVVGLVILSLSGFILSHASASLATAFNINGTVFGMTILAFATTLPEKTISLVTGSRRESNLVVATTGSNIFLLTLCLGVLFTAGGKGDRGELLGESLVAFEVWSIWACSLVLMMTVLVGGRRWMGALLLGGYVGFLGSEFVYGGR